MDSIRIIELLDPPEAELQLLSGTCSSMQELLDEYIRNTQLKLSKAMRVDLLNLYREGYDG